MTTICHHNHVAALFKQVKKKTHTHFYQYNDKRSKNTDTMGEREKQGQ